MSISLSESASAGELARLHRSGSQTARSATERPRQHAGFTARTASTSSLPPPPLPRAALQLPRAAGAQESPRAAVALAHAADTHRITRWLSQTMVGVGQPVAKQVEGMFWPSSPSYASGVRSQPQLQPLRHAASERTIRAPRDNAADSSEMRHELEQTIASQKVEIESLKRQAQTQTQLDMTYEELQVENRSLRHLKTVIAELQSKSQEMRELHSERSQHASRQLSDATAAFDELAARHESMKIDFETLQRVNTERESAHASLTAAHDALRTSAEEQRLTLLAQSESLHSLQSQHASTLNDLLLVSSQLDSSKSSQSYLKSELVSLQSEVASLSRVRELQANHLDTMASQRTDSQAQIAALELRMADVDALVSTRALLRASESDRRTLEEALTKLQNRVDTLEALVEEYQVQERMGWQTTEGHESDEEGDEEDGGDESENEASSHAPSAAASKLAIALTSHEATSKAVPSTPSTQPASLKPIVIIAGIKPVIEQAEVTPATTVTPSVASAAPPAIAPRAAAPPAVVPAPIPTPAPVPAQPTAAAVRNAPAISSRVRRRTMRASASSAAGTAAASEAASVAVAPVPAVAVPAAAVAVTLPPPPTPSPAASPAVVVVKSPSAPSSKKHHRSPSKSSAPLPVAQTSLSRRLEKCLNDSLQENTVLSERLYQVQLQSRSLQTREDANVRRIDTLTSEVDAAARERARLLANQRQLDSQLVDTEQRCTTLLEDLSEEKLVSERRANDLRKTRTEVAQLRRGLEAAESASASVKASAAHDLSSLRAQLSLEVRQRETASAKVDALTSELRTVLSQHGVERQAKQQIVASFTRTNELNNELAVKLSLAEAAIARAKPVEDRLAQVEQALTSSEARCKRIGAESDSLQASLQSLSESHTEQTGTLQRALVKSQHLAIENGKLSTRIANLLAQLNSEEHAKTSTSSQVKAAALESAMARERVEALEAQLTEEKRLHAARLDHYRSARKESQTNKTKLFNLKSTETRLRAQLEKEIARGKKLEMDNLRLRAGGPHAPHTLSASSSTAALGVSMPSSSSVTSLTSSNASIANLHAALANEEAEQLIPVRMPSRTHSLADGGGGGGGSDDEDLLVNGPISLSRQSTTDSPLQRAHTPLGVLIDFNLNTATTTPPANVAPLTPEETAQAEAERKREEERRMRRRPPKRITTGGSGGTPKGDRSEKEDDSTPGATNTPTRGFYADLMTKRKGLGATDGAATASPSASRRPSSSIAAGGLPPTHSSPKPPLTPGLSRRESPARSEDEVDTTLSYGSPLAPEASATSLTAPFFDATVAPPKSLAAANDRLTAQTAALAALVDLNRSQARAAESRAAALVAAAEERAEKDAVAIKSAQERAEHAAERSRAALRTEREKYDALLATNIKSEAAIKQLKNQIAVMKAKAGDARS